jgi:hypothetical protein
MTLVFLANCMVDPLWVWPNRLGMTRKYAQEERLSKTNYLVHAAPVFHNLVLGSSRASYLPVRHLGPGWFNYACMGMHPGEFVSYARMAQDHAKGGRLDTILVGLDFWATRNSAIVVYDSLAVFVSKSNDMWGQALNYLSGYSFAKSLEMIRLNYWPKANTAYYLWPHLAKGRSPMPPALRETAIRDQLWYYEQDVFGEGYVFDKGYFGPLQLLVEAFPHSKVIFYLSPVNPRLAAIIAKYNRGPCREKWLDGIRSLGADVIVPQQELFVDTMFFDAHHLKPWHFHLVFAQGPIHLRH